MRPEVHVASAITKPISRLHFCPQPQAPQGPPSRAQFSPNGHRLAIGGNGNSAAAAPSENGAGWPPGNAQQQQQQQQPEAVNSFRRKSERATGNPSTSQQSGNGKQPQTGTALRSIPQNGQARQLAPLNGNAPQQQKAPLPTVLRHPMGPKRLFQRETPLDKPGGTAVQDTYSMWDFYCDNWRPFGELLTDMEREGFLVNR